MEAKLDELLRKVEPGQAEEIIRSLDDRYGGWQTDAPHGQKREGTE